MTFCVSRNFTVDFRRDDNVLLDSLFFQLQIRSGAITGRVFPSVGTTPLSDVFGTCQSFTSPDVSLFTLNFTWNALSVSFVGVVFLHRGNGRITIVGRFGAAARADAEASEAVRDPDAEASEAVQDPDAKSTLIPPSDGDTGTASGQQT